MSACTLTATQSRDALVNEAEAFIKKTACKYTKNFRIDFDDLYQEGRLEALKQAERFDQERGMTFLTFAANAIRGAMLRLVKDSQTLKVSDKAFNLNWKMVKAQQEYAEKYETQAPVEYLAEALGVSEARINDLLPLNQRPHSLSETFKNSDEPRFDGVVMDEDADDFVQYPEGRDNYIADLVRRALSLLSPRDEKIVRYFYGIGCDPLTREQISELVGLTRQRIGQILAAANGVIYKHPEIAALGKIPA